VRKLAEHYPQRSLKQLTERQGFQYLIFRRDEQKLRPSTLNQAVVALRLFYQDFLQRDRQLWRQFDQRRLGGRGGESRIAGPARLRRRAPLRLPQPRRGARLAPGALPPRARTGLQAGAASLHHAVLLLPTPDDPRRSHSRCTRSTSEPRGPFPRGMSLTLPRHHFIAPKSTRTLAMLRERSSFARTNLAPTQSRSNQLQLDLVSALASRQSRPSDFVEQARGRLVMSLLPRRAFQQLRRVPPLQKLIP
jgi:hypothetical protein